MFFLSIKCPSGAEPSEALTMSGVDINAVNPFCAKAERNYIPDFMRMVGEVLTYVQILRPYRRGVKGQNDHSHSMISELSDMVLKHFRFLSASFNLLN